MALLSISSAIRFFKIAGLSVTFIFEIIKTKYLPDPQKYSAKELLLQIAAGDDGAFGIFFKLYANELYTQAFKILKSEFWAEEIVQEVFVQVWVNRLNLASLESPVAYIFRMLANKALDRIRKHEVEVRMQYSIGRNASSSDTNDTDQSGNRFDKIDQLLLQAIEALPAQRKLIYQLKYHHGLSYEEIAGKLAVSKHTVRNQLAKALHSIRLFLGEKGDILLLLYLFASFFA